MSTSGDVSARGEATDEVTVRARSDDDLTALGAIVERTFERSAYPEVLPPDPAGWLTGANARTPFWSSLVALRRGAVVGHVAVASAIGDPAEQTWAAALGVPAERLAVVKRLVVDPAHEGAGVGRLLLETAVCLAHERNLWPVLDTVDARSRAVRLYERAGWRSIGRIEMEAGKGGWSVGATLRCFAGPPPPRDGMVRDGSRTPR